MKKAWLGVVLLLAGVAAILMKRPSAKAPPRPEAPSMADSTPTIQAQVQREPLPATVPNPPVIVRAGGPSPDPKATVELKLPRGHSAERAYSHREWKLPRSLNEALAKNPALTDKLAQHGPEISGMVDFKLGWLPRLEACTTEQGISYRGFIDIDFHFELDDSGDQWVGRNADVKSSALGDEEDKVLVCVGKTFSGIKRPIMDPNHGDSYVYKTRVTLPATSDYVYQFIGKDEESSSSKQ